jgi:hypothetical protein
MHWQSIENDLNDNHVHFGTSPHVSASERLQIRRGAGAPLKGAVVPLILFALRPRDIEITLAGRIRQRPGRGLVRICAWVSRPTLDEDVPLRQTYWEIVLSPVRWRRISWFNHDSDEVLLYYNLRRIFLLVRRKYLLFEWGQSMYYIYNYWS